MTRPVALSRTIAAACLAALLCQAPALAQTAPAPAYTPQSGQEGKDVVWIPTHQGLVDRMLDMAQVTPADYLVDLGSGDGRTVITAAKRGVRALGIEYNPDLVTLSAATAKAEGVADRARFIQADIFESDFSDATVVTLFLLPTLNMKLRPIILAMKPGTRVVSNTFNMGDWIADQTIEAPQTDCTNFCRAYRWVVPAKAEGTWKLGDGELRLKQTFQMLEGTLRQGGQEVAISEARMNGAEIAFTAGDRQFTGSVDGGRMTGTSRTPQGSQAWSAARSAP
ncbi:methyltransferase family protein [Stella humosa]|uniref:Methyltransferase family protein n=1 Tax=Stella humosa TaxID=94 RepID=A0A3N1KZW1_9PROT|nr:class I SAM-dependent methyltransferase [Stella humosa]ROP84200.1 methyltransferase family protein [Stella humosa]BBK33712.1 methyltransferase [Stella humosa]